MTLGHSKKKFWKANSKIQLSEALCDLVVSVCAKFEGCAAKTVKEVRFFRVTGFSKIALLPNFASRLSV